jgi:diguanylate cyclase (GGDEF)-like protein
VHLNNTLLSSILNALPENIVVIDQTGLIQYVNQSWQDFSCANANTSEPDWLKINYLEQCDRSAEKGDTFGEHAAEGIRLVINKIQENFYLEYPCHSPAEKRWFMMRVSPVKVANNHYYVISHHNITERKIAEEKVEQLSRMDGLTNIHNRRSFDEFLHSEWLRCTRLKMPITLAMIDIDYFKQLNDNFGHQFGDLCLIKIAESLKEFARRPGDMCARYGGEEFAIILGDTELEDAFSIIERALDAIHQLEIPSPNDTKVAITASIGLVTFHPDGKSEEQALITSADELLYQAKKSGRDRIISQNL